jgi:hypothetical protein
MARLAVLLLVLTVSCVLAVRLTPREPIKAASPGCFNPQQVSRNNSRKKEPSFSTLKLANLVFSLLFLCQTFEEHITSPRPQDSMNLQTLPSSYDWRSTGWLSSIRNERRMQLLQSK